MHTTISDGHVSPEEAAEIYRRAGYDAVVFSDHRLFGEERLVNGLRVLSGAEYNTPTKDCRDGVYHIVGFGMEKDPEIELGYSPQEIIDRIHGAGGVAILAHPAWSLNDPEQIMALRGVDATEIYNSVSGVHHSRRPDSSLIVDMLASRGRYYPLLATDDAHYYDTDHCRSWIMVEAEELSAKAVKDAVVNGRFYATQGPELHLLREGGEILVKTTPCEEIYFLSNLVWAPRVFERSGITEARYTPADGERYVRAVARDKNGNLAWSNILVL
ncbi:MAG: hypothetical protein E7620_02405 [Ruminococcaceae bacterium]|nr:hypothetical protein [Oscillospiraceae bacterium]